MCHQEEVTWSMSHCARDTTVHVTPFLRKVPLSLTEHSLDTRGNLIFLILLRTFCKIFGWIPLGQDYDYQFYLIPLKIELTIPMGR